MLIRSSQMDAFGAYSLNQYKSALCLHLQAYDPILAEVAGPDAVEKTVDLGLQSAGDCGFTLRGPIRTYLEIMFSLGSYFPRDPLYFWLLPWLQPQEYYTEMDRARYLQFHVVRFLDDVQGINGAEGIQSLKNSEAVTDQDLIKLGRGYPEGATDWLVRMNPRKCGFVGEDALQSLIESASKEAAQAGIPGLEGFPIVLWLMFTFGRGILSDPMYPWAAQALRSPDVNEKLLSTGKAFLKARLK